jgi:predicted XRE-type DNA-binding protein
MKKQNQKPHITKGSVFEDLGFSPEESAALKIKADIYLQIKKSIESGGYNQKDLGEILAQPQPRVSELINGKISKISIEKLLGYLEALGHTATIRFKKHAV